MSLAIDRPTALPQLSIRPPVDDAQRVAKQATSLDRAEYLAGVHREASVGRAAAQAIPSTPIDVRPGDTLESIAATYGTTVGQLAQLNPTVADLDAIRAGDRLNVPTNRQVVEVQPGDTLTGLAERYGVSVEQLQRTNGITDPDRIEVGDRFAVVPSATYGLDQNSEVQAFIEDVLPLQQDWATLTPAERLERLSDAINERMRAAGVPEITVLAGGAGDNNGVYEFSDHAIRLDPDMLNSATIDSQGLRDVADTLYHEGRHAEQWFDMARLTVAQGGDPADLQIEPGVAEAARNAPALDPGSDRGRYAEAMLESVYGGGADDRNEILGNITADNYEQYRALPEEADAWRVGGKVQNLWPQ